MPTSILRIAVCTTIVLGAAACGGGSGEEFTAAGPFDKKEDVSTWANTASAAGVYSHVYEPLAIADGQQSFADPECPVVEDDGTTWTATGGCTDSEGTKFGGTVSIERNGGDRHLVYTDHYDGFYSRNGTFDLREVDVERYEFDAALQVGDITTIEYTGSVQGGYNRRTLWNGSGTAERRGFFPPTGTVDASTIDQVWDSKVCPGQAVSGRTKLKAGDDTAVITYDGEADCDSDHNAQLTVNEEDQGLVSDVTCNVHAPGRGGHGALGLFLLALAAPAARRALLRATRYPPSSTTLRQTSFPNAAVNASFLPSGENATCSARSNSPLARSSSISTARSRAVREL